MACRSSTLGAVALAAFFMFLTVSGVGLLTTGLIFTQDRVDCWVTDTSKCLADGPLGLSFVHPAEMTADKVSPKFPASQIYQNRLYALSPLESTVYVDRRLTFCHEKCCLQEAEEQTTLSCVVNPFKKGQVLSVFEKKVTKLGEYFVPAGIAALGLVGLGLIGLMAYSVIKAVRNSGSVDYQPLREVNTTSHNFTRRRVGRNGGRSGGGRTGRYHRY